LTALSRDTKLSRVCSFFSIMNRPATAVIAVVLLSATPAAAQDWRTSGEDPCACTDSMPFIIGARPPIDNAEQVADRVRESAEPSGRTARAAVESLRDASADARATRALVDRLSSGACAIRASAAWSLVHHHSPAIAPALLRVLDDRDRRVRQAAAYALGFHGDAQSVRPLVALLTEPTKHVRQAAVEALGRIGDRAARPAVEQLLSDPEPHVRAAAAEALRRLDR
jgi:HEAT repeat protein